MPELVLESMPLRDRLREAEQLVRELGDHLDHGVAPKIRETSRLTRPAPPERLAAVPDSTIRSSVDASLSTHEYTLLLARKLERFLGSIDREFQHLASGESH